MPVTCLDRFSSEINPCQDWYSVCESEGTFDVEKTFAPSSTKAVVLKFLALAYVTFVFVYSLWNADDRAIWFGMLTNITLLFSVEKANITMSETSKPQGMLSSFSKHETKEGSIESRMTHVSMTADLLLPIFY